MILAVSDMAVRQRSLMMRCSNQSALWCSCCYAQTTHMCNGQSLLCSTADTAGFAVWHKDQVWRGTCRPCLQPGGFRTCPLSQQQTCLTVADMSVAGALRTLSCYAWCPYLEMSPALSCAVFMFR
jgi:hypothetical protein